MKASVERAVPEHFRRGFGLVLGLPLTEGHAINDLTGLVLAEVHALVGNGKGGKEHTIQHFRCQACRCSFSSRRNTPLYYLKTSSDQIEMCLWLLAEGVDISVLVHFTGHVDATVTRWLLHCFPIRSSAAWERLRDGLEAAGLPRVD